MVLSLGIDGFWELRSIKDNTILFQIHDDMVPDNENRKSYIMRMFDLCNF